MAVISIRVYLVVIPLVMAVGGCVSPTITLRRGEEPVLRRFILENPPPVMSDGAPTGISLGGFSGLIYDGPDPKTGELRFLTHTDRGPNAPLVDQKKKTKNKSQLKNERVAFAVPKFSPELVSLALDLKTGRLRVTERKSLKVNANTPLTGLPNRVETDGTPVDAKGRKLSLDPRGLDLECVVRLDDGTYWVGDEYRPSLVHFSAEGVLIKRVVPKGTKIKSAPNILGEEAEGLPASFALREQNRGFEGCAVRGTKIYAFLQSALRRPGGRKSDGYDQVVRVVEYDRVSGQSTGEYIYLSPSRDHDWKIGDIALLPDGSFLVLEQISQMGTKAERKIQRVSLEGATNLATLPTGTDLNIDGLDLKALLARNIQPMKKEEIIDLAKAGYNFASKVEGLSVIDRRTLALINDEDFGLEGEKTEMVLVTLERDLFH